MNRTNLAVAAVFALLMVAAGGMLSLMEYRDLETFAKWTIYVSTVPAVAFPILYAFRPWWRSPIGRALMTKGVGIALLFGMSTMQLIDLYVMRPWMQAWIYLLVGVGITFQALVLVTTPRDRTRSQYEARDHDSRD